MVDAQNDNLADFERLLIIFTYIEKMKAWKASPKRKPLILWGARQTGKTWAMKKFGEDFFENVVYVSFYNNHRIAKIFEKDYDV